MIIKGEGTISNIRSGETLQAIGTVFKRSGQSLSEGAADGRNYTISDAQALANFQSGGTLIPMPNLVDRKPGWHTITIKTGAGSYVAIDGHTMYSGSLPITNVDQIQLAIYQLDGSCVAKTAYFANLVVPGQTTDTLSDLSSWTHGGGTAGSYTTGQTIDGKSCVKFDAIARSTGVHTATKALGSSASGVFSVDIYDTGQHFMMAFIVLQNTAGTYNTVVYLWDGIDTYNLEGWVLTTLDNSSIVLQNLYSFPPILPSTAVSKTIPVVGSVGGSDVESASFQLKQYPRTYQGYPYFNFAASTSSSLVFYIKLIGEASQTYIADGNGSIAVMYTLDGGTLKTTTATWVSALSLWSITISNVSSGPHLVTITLMTQYGQSNTFTTYCNYNNLLTNGNFEGGFTGGVPNGWTEVYDGTVTSHTIASTTDCYHETYATKLDQNSTTSMGYHYIYQIVTGLTAGKTYMISALIKHTGVATAYVWGDWGTTGGVYSANGLQYALSGAPAATVWRPYTATAVCPTGCDRIKICASARTVVNSANTMYIDNVYLGQCN